MQATRSPIAHAAGLDAASVPLVLYDIPYRTGVRIERALGDQVGIARHRHVVVVVVESPRREAGRAREGVQFVERSVRNEVAELRAVGRPAGRIDQHRHISRR